MAADDALETAINDAFAMIDGVEKNAGGLEADVVRLTQEKSSLEASIKSLPAEIGRLKTERAAVAEQIESAKRDLDGLQSQIEAAKVQIARGEQAARILASISTQ